MREKKTGERKLGKLKTKREGGLRGGVRKENRNQIINGEKIR